MFYNHAAEKERRRKADAQLRAREIIGEMAPDHFPSRPATSTEVHRWIPASSHLTPRENSSPVIPQASSEEGSSRSRPELWPPSHSEIISGLEGENTPHGATIPGWFRGPLLLPSSGDSVYHASSLPGNLALSNRPIPTRSRSSDGAKREPFAIGALSRGEGGARTPPAKTEGIIGVGRALGDKADTGERASDEEGQGQGEGESKFPDPAPRAVYSPDEERAIRRVLEKLEAASKDDPSLVRFPEFTTNMWIKLVSEPLIRELESDATYIASGRQPRKRFAHETGVATLRRWVSEDARRRHASRSATARKPTSERETKAERYTDTSGGEAVAKNGSGRPRRGVHYITPASSFGADAKMEAGSASTNASTDDSGRDSERGGGRWGLSIVGYPEVTGLGSDVAGVSESSADGHGSGEGESSSEVSASEDDSSHRRFEDDDDGGSSHSSSSWNSSWNSSRWGGSGSGQGHGTGVYEFPNRLNIGPSESRLRIHSAIAGGEAKPLAPSGEDGKTGDSIGPSDAPSGSRWLGGPAIGGGIRKPTPPKRRRRVAAGPAVLQWPDVDDAASSYEATPAQAAAAEADKLNTLMQARRPRPPPHQLPRPTVPSLRDHRVEASAQGTLALERTASNAGVTTATASATMTSTPTGSSSPNSRASSLTPGAKGRKWCLTRGDSSKKVGPRQLSRDSNGTPTSAAGEAGAAAEGRVSSDGSKESVPARPPLRSPPESRADKKAESTRKDEDLAWERGAAAASAAMVAAEKRYATVDWPGSPRKEPSRVRRVLFSSQGPTKSYLRLHLVVWIVATALLVADRLLWNLWPRQSVFPSAGNDFCGDGACGTDYFCAVDEAAGCLAEGPGSVKAYDAIARATGRTIITTTNLILATLCHGTWGWLSQTKYLREFLRGWRDDNALLRSIGVWTMAASVVLHVYSVLLPFAVDDFEIAILEPKGVSWPAQLTPTNVDPRVDVKAEVVTWAPDDLGGLLWLSVALALSASLLARRLCLPRCSCSGGGGGSSRCGDHGAYALLSGWLKPILGAAVMAESFRRRSHPHVWVLNGPVLLWLAVDILRRRFSRRFDSYVAGARVALGSEHDLLLWDIATACEKPSLTHTPSGPSKIGGIVMMGPTGDIGSGRISRCTAAATTATTAAVFSASLSLSLSAVRGVVTVRREAAGAGESLPDPQPARPKIERPSPSAKATAAMKNAEEIRGRHGADSVHGGMGSRSDSEGSGEWPPAEAKVSAEVADASESGAVAAGSEAETDESDAIGEDESFSETSLASAITDSSIASSKERKQTSREEMTWRTSSGARNSAPTLALTRRSQSEELPGGQALKSLVSSPTSASESTGTGQRLSVESPPEIPRGLWGNPPVENAEEEGQDTGLLGRELVPSESRGRGKSDLGIDDDDAMSSAGESASDSTRSSAPGSDGTGAAEEGDTATLFFSREPGRLRQVVLDPLSPSRRATPFLLEEPLPYISGRRLASVPYDQSTGAKPGGGGKVLESEDRGGRSGGGEGEPLGRFSFAGLSATAFFLSSGRPEDLGKGVAGRSSRGRDSDRLRGVGSDGGGGRVNNPDAKESAREGAREFDSDSSSSDDRLPTSEVRPPTPPVRRNRSLRSASSSRSAHSVSAGGGTTRGQTPGASRGNGATVPWTWRPNGSDQELESNGEKRHEEGEGKQEEETTLSTTLQWRERSENPPAMASEAFWKGPGKGETVVMVDASAETSFVEVTVQRRVHAPARAARAGTKVSGARAGSARDDKKNAAVLAKTHETTRRMSTSDYLSFVDSLCRPRIATPEAHLSRAAPRAPITSATTDSSRTRPRSYTREPSPTTAGGDPEEESPLGDLDSAGDWSCSSSEVVEDPVDLRAETVTAPSGTVTWQRLAIVRAPRRVEAARDKDRNSSRKDLPSRLEAGTLGEVPRVEDDLQARTVEVRAMKVDTTGPFPSALGRLASYPELPPLLVVATGAGAGLVIEFLAFAAASEKVPVRAVTVCYSCDSPSLLRFVTSELLARRVSGVRIVTVLLEPGSSGGVDQVKDQQSTADRGSQEILSGRLNLEDFVKKAPTDTEVYFCGELRFDKSLRTACGRMCLAYASARVLENV